MGSCLGGHFAFAYFFFLRDFIFIVLTLPAHAQNTEASIAFHANTLWNSSSYHVSVILGSYYNGEY